MLRRYFFAFVLSLDLLAAGIAAADGGATAVRRDTPSGLPVPRYVEFAGAESNCRAGPSRAHAVKFEYRSKGLPVMVVAETVDHWRKVRDAAGDECWVFHTLTRAPRHALVREPVALRQRPEAGAPVTAELGEGVLAEIQKRRDGWALVRAGEASGWMRATGVWGLDLGAPARRN